MLVVVPCCIAFIRGGTRGVLGFRGSVVGWGGGFGVGVGGKADYNAVWVSQGLSPCVNKYTLMSSQNIPL